MPDASARALLVDAGAPGDNPGPEAFVALAEAAEAAGLTHLVLRARGGRDAFVLLGRIAAATRRLGLGAALPPGERPPALVAKALSSLDVLSGGRALALVAPEAPGGGAPGADLAAEVGEELEVLRLLQRVPAPDYRGVRHHLRRAWNEPRRPVPPPVGVLVPAAPPDTVAALLSVAARAADLVVVGGDTPRVLAGALEGAAAAAGRGTGALVLWTPVGGTTPPQAALSPASGLLWRPPPGHLPSPDALRGFASR